MDKKRFIVAVSFKGEVEADNDSEALAAVSWKVREAFDKTRGLSLTVIAAIPNEQAQKEAQPKTVREVTTDKCEGQ